MQFTETHDDEEMQDDHEEVSRGGCLGRLFKIFLMVMVPVLIIVGLLPSVFSSDGARTWALKKVNDALAPRTLSVKRWSFGWFQPPVFTQMDYFDPEQGISFKADSVTGDKGLIGMLPFGTWNLGRMTVKHPELSVTTVDRKKDGASAASEHKGKAGSKGPSDKKGFALPVTDLACTLVVEDGKIAVQAPSGASFSADHLDSEVGITSLREPVKIHSTMRVGMGKISVEGSVLSPAAMASGKVASTPEKLTVKLQQLDLSLFSALLKMMKANVWIESGVAEGELSFSVAGFKQVIITGGVLVNGFSVAGEKMKASPKAELALMADLDYADQHLKIKALDFASPWLRTRSKGELEFGSAQKKMVGTLTMESDSDLKAIVRDFGPVLGLSPEFSMQSGRLMMNTELEAGDQGLSVQAQVTTADLLMKYAGEPLLLKPAPSLTLKARFPQGSQIPEIGELHIRAPFADVSARGKMESGSVNGTVSLTAFSKDFRRIFKNLPPMVGALEFSLETQQAESRISLTSQLSVSDLAAELKPGERMVIQKGTLKASAFIQREGDSPSLEDIAFSFQVPNGECSGKCKRLAMTSTEDQGKTKRVPVVRGLSLASNFEWSALRRLIAPFLSDQVRRATAEMSGNFVMNATAEMAKGETKVLMNAAGQRIAVAHSNLMVKVPDVRMETTLSQSKPNTAYQVKTSCTGTFACLRDNETVFAEKDASVKADISIDPDGARVEMKNLAVASELIAFKGKADLSELKSRCVLTAEGQSTLDCERLTMLLDAQGLDTWQLTGRATRPFTFKAPLAGGINTLFAEGQMDCAVAVATAQGMGLKAGASDASVKLANGRMDILYAPSLNQGKLKVNPVLTMERNNLSCTVPPKTRVLEEVQLSQEMLDGLLLRLFPLFQGSLAQEGKVSLDVNAFTYTTGLPVEQGLAADIAIQLKDVKVLFGQTFRDLLAKLRSRTTVWEQEKVTIHAKMVSGRLILEPVTLVIDRHPIVFSGWVDSKGKINYMLEITLTERMLGDKGGKAIGKAVKVPITGTVTSPTIEPSALLKALTPAAAEVLQEEIKDHAKDILENLRKELKKKKNE